MATQAQIFECRLSIKDPLGYINIIEVDTSTSLPATPIAQTLYYITDIDEYKAYESSMWVHVDVELSNERYSTFIDLYGIEKAQVKIIKEIVRSLGQKLYISRTQNGTESVDYQNLTTMKNYYDEIIKELTEAANETSGSDTGKYIHTRQPPVGGMNL